MPWKETGPLEQRVQFLSEWKKGEASMAALCRAFGISRPTGYKWVARYFEDGGEGGVRGLEDFKGHFRMQDGERCHPLTMTDAYSRLLLRCEERASTHHTALGAWHSAKGRV